MKNQNLKTCELDEIVRNSIYNHGLYPHLIESMNAFYMTGLNEILTDIFKIEKIVPMIRKDTDTDREIETVKFEIKFLKVNLSRPSESKDIAMLPCEARLRDKSYMGFLYADVLIRATAFLHNGETRVKEEKIEKHIIAELPIMVGSIFCNTYQMPRAALEKIGEDPSDPQGIFLINGSEWVINNLISRKYNLWYIFHNEYGKEHARAEFISIPGDSFENSSEIKIIYYNSGEINIILTSDRYFKTIEFPFYVILKLFGIPTEKSIIDCIAPLQDDNNDDLTPKIREILENACTVRYSGLKTDVRGITDYSILIDTLIDEIAIKYVETKGYVSLEDRQRYILIEKKILKEVIMENFDNNVLPHQGKSPENRFSKALYICIGIRKMLECFFDVVEQTDRDSNEHKRIQPAGDSFARMFKKEVNKALVNQLRVNVEEMANKNSFDDYDLVACFKSGCKSSSLKSKIISNLNQGMYEKIVNGERIKNRMPSEGLKRKNHANTINSGSVQRSVQSSQPQNNERSKQIRDIMPSYPGTNCIIQTAEGVNAGMVQNTTMGTQISMSTSTDIMINILLDTEEVIPYDKIMGMTNIYTKVYVNGKWIGYTKNPHILYNTFRERRRGWDVKTGKRIEKDIMDRKMTMCWNNKQKEIDFRTDRGRPLSPHVVVVNNSTIIGQKILGTHCNPKTGEGFEQRILITNEHINKLKTNEITIDYLFDQGFIDYVAPEELKQLIDAETLEKLELNKNNFYDVYTHACIPATLLSITSSLTPHLHNCPPVRASLAGNHLRQACGLYATNFNKRFDKQGFVQQHNQFPLVYTNANLYTIGMGMNAEICITTNGGLNIEDSLCSNQSAFQRGMYNVNKYTFIKVTLEKDEEFGVPNERITEHINKHANYGKLNNEGHVARGTKIVKGDVLIGKMFKYSMVKVGVITYRDVSEVYDEDEIAYVSDIEKGSDGELNKFIKIRLEIPRVMGKGQKMASRSGQKGMTASVEPQSDFPFTMRGKIPVLCLSPMAFPSRLTCNQLKEGIQAKLGQLFGTCYDGSFTITTDDDQVAELFEKNGYHRYGTEVMFRGTTGQPFITNLFISPIYQCRLQKFSEEGAYGVGDVGQRNYVTRQPISGRSRDGGIRLGEMEKDCLCSHGVVRFMHTKLFKDCDGIDIYICRNCGYRAIGNEKEQIAICGICGPRAKIYKFPTRFASHLVLNIFEAMGVEIKFISRPYKFNLNL